MFSLGFGAVAGALFGVGRAQVLGPQVRGVSNWVLGNVFGWAFGLPLAYIAGSLWRRNWALCVAVGTFIATRWMQPKPAFDNVPARALAPHRCARRVDR